MQILLLGATGRTGSLVVQQAITRGHNVTALVRSASPNIRETLTSALPDDKKKNLTLIQGSPLNAQDVINAVAAATTGTSTTTTLTNNGGGNNEQQQQQQLVIISTLQPRRTSDNPFAPPHPTDSPPRMMADSIANVIAALPSQTQPQPAESASASKNNHQDKIQKPKIIVLSALGTGSSNRNAHFLLRALFRYSNMKLTYDDHDAVAVELENAADEGLLDFVIVRPTRLAEAGHKDDGSVDFKEPRVFGQLQKGGGGVVGLMEKVSRASVARFLLDAAESSSYNGQAPIIIE